MKLRTSEKIWLLAAALCAAAAISVTAAYRLPACAAAPVLAPMETSAAPAVTSAAETVDINSATTAQLDDLPGIGPKLAERIVAWRQTNGPFKTAADIMKVSGIGAGKYEKLKDRIAVTQEGTT